MEDIEVKQPEVVEPSEQDAKNAIAENETKKEINYSQALREKNQKIQELKTAKDEAEARIKSLEDENKNLQSWGYGNTGESENLKKEIDLNKKQLLETQNQLKELSQKSEEVEKERVKQLQVQKLESELSKLRKKYPDFDENKVIAHAWNVWGDSARIEDLEAAYKTLKFDELNKVNAQESASTEGGSIVGVTPSSSHPKSYDEVVEKFKHEEKK